MQKLRKAFTISVMIMTVLSMSVVVAPQASAAASAGDLIKMDGLSSVYYLGADGKRYVFPNEATYFSWYSDFSGVVTIPQSELESYPLGKNVTMRPGTKLVKITTNPKVYAVTPNGVLKAIPDEATALALYGENWAQRIVDVPDAFFTNYTISSQEVSATSYPEGSLVKFGEGADVYYIDASGNARKIADESAFLANRFRWDDVISSSLTLPTTGADITGAEADLTDTSSGAGGTAGAGTGLTVAIASDTPAAGNIPAGSPVDFLKLNFTAAADGDVNINAFTLSAYDLGTATNIDSVTIYDNGVIIGTSKNMTSDRIASFNFSTPINIPAGTTKSLTVRATIASSVTSGNFAIGLKAASDITTNGAVVSGSFPIIGNTKAIVDATIGSVTLGSVVSTGSTNDFGEDDVLLASFDLAVANEPVLWESARFKNGGTNKDGIVSNMRLLIDGDVVAEGASLVDKYVTFDLGNYVIAKGDTVSVEVYGDLGVSNNNDTISLYIKEANDFSFIGQDYGYGIELSGADNLDTVSDANTVTLTTGDFTIDMDKAVTPAKDVRAGDDNVVLATIKMTSNGENATVESIASGTSAFKITGTGLDEDGEITNVELRDVDSGVVYDVTATYDATNDKYDLSMTDEFTLLKGVTKTFELRCDLTGPNETHAIEENTTLQVTLTGGAMTVTGDESDASITDITPSSVTSAIATVKAADLDWTTSSLTAKSIVPGAEDVLIYKAALQAGDSSYIDLTSVKISVTTAGANSFTDNNISKLDLYLNGKLLKSKSNAISEGAGSDRGYILFNSLPAGTRRIAAGSAVVLELKASFASSFTTTGSWSLGIENTTTSIVAKDMDNNSVAEDLQQPVNTASRAITLANTGTLKVELKTDDSKANDDTYILAGSETAQDRYLGELVFTTANEDVLVKTLVLGQYGTANGGDIKAVKLYDKNGVEVASTYSTAAGHANFSSFDMTMPADQSTSLFIGVETKTINADGDAEGTASSSATIIYGFASSTVLTSLGLSSGEAVTAQGVDSGIDITMAEDDDATPEDNEYSFDGKNSKTATIAGAVLTSIVNAMDDGTLVGGSRTIAKYKFTFDNGTNRTTSNDELKAQLVELILTVATSSNTSVDNVQAYIEGDSSNKTTAVHLSGSTFTIDLDAAGKLAEDGLVDGEITLVITGDVTTSGSGEYIQTEINDLSSDFTYNGNNGSATSDFSDARLEISEVTGATLSN